MQTVQALIDALPAAEDISDANADEVSGQLDAIDEAKQALTEEQAARLDLTGYDAAAAAVLAALCVLASNRHRIPELTVYGVWTFVFAAGTFLLQLAVHRSVFD